jgi:hypothetical protein
MKCDRAVRMIVCFSRVIAWSVERVCRTASGGIKNRGLFVPSAARVWRLEDSVAVKKQHSNFIESQGISLIVLATRAARAICHRLRLVLST